MAFFNKIFAFKYNFLVLLQVILGLLNTVLIMKLLGVSDESDSYFIAFGIVSTIQLLLLMLVEQFLIFYNDIKSINQQDAEDFFSTVFVYSILSGVLVSIVLISLCMPIIDVFASGLQSDSSLKVLNMLKILFWSFAIYPALFVLSSYLNANSYYAIPYIASIVPTFFTFLYLLYVFVNSTVVKLEILSMAYFLGYISSFFLLYYFSYRFNSIKFSVSSTYLKPFIKNSISIRFAHNIHNFIFLFFTNNFLSHLHNGEITQFFYAKKGADILNSIVNGPSQKILAVNVSKLLPAKDYNNIKVFIKKFIERNITVFVLLSIVTYFLIPIVLSLISTEMNYASILGISTIFAFITIMNVIMILEIPYAIVCISSKESQIFYLSNSLFAITLVFLTLALSDYFNIFSLLIAMNIAQLINFYLIRKKGKTLIYTNESI